MRASLSPNPADERLILIDLVRWFSFYAIVVYHLTSALWSRYGLTAIPFRGAWLWPLESFGRALAFSGFTVLFLSFFLMGMRGRRSRKARSLPLILAGFMVLWWLTAADYPYLWDIYPFLLCAWAATVLTRRWPAHWLMVISAAGLSLPLWRLEGLFPAGLATVITGACGTRADLGDWPLLPWVLWPVFAHSAGRFAASRSDGWAALHRGETLVWVAMLAASAPFLGGYYATPLGEEFGCFVFRQSATVFWAHMIWIFAAVRCAFLKAVQRPLSARPWARALSDSPVNRGFFIVYFSHFPAVTAYAYLARVRGWDHEPWVLAAGFTAALALIELPPVVFRRILNDNGGTEAPWQRTNARSSTI